MPELLNCMARPAGIEPATLCLEVKQASSTVFSQLLPFVALTRFWGVCFRSQRLRLARLQGEFSDGFLTVVAATAMLYGLRSTWLQQWFRTAIAPLVVRTRFVEPGDLLSPTTARTLSPADLPSNLGPTPARGIRLRPSTNGVAQRNGFATIQHPTCFQGLRRCETLLQYRFDWRYLYAMLIGYAHVHTL